MENNTPLPGNPGPTKPAVTAPVHPPVDMSPATLSKDYVPAGMRKPSLDIDSGDAPTNSAPRKTYTDRELYDINNKDAYDVASSSKVSNRDMDENAQSAIETQNQIEAFAKINKQGYFTDSTGNRQDNSKLDNASMWDVMRGQSYITDKNGQAKLARMTTDYASDTARQWNKEDGHTAKDVAGIRDSSASVLGILPGFEQMIGGLYNQEGFKMYTDPVTNQSSLVPFNSKNSKDYMNAVSAYGPKQFHENFFAGLNDGVSVLLGDLMKGTASLAKMGKDLIDPTQDSAIDKIYDHLEKQEVLNRNQDFANSGSLDSSSGIAKGIGTGVAMMISFAAGGASASSLASVVTKSEKIIALSGRLGAGFMMTAGPALAQAKEAGLPPRNAAGMAFLSGMVGSVVQEAIGANEFTKYLLGEGKVHIPDLAFSEIKAMGGKMTEESIEKAVPNILEKVMGSVNDFQKKASMVPYVGSVTEQGVQMGVQTALLNSGNELYNWAHKDDKGVSEGNGLYNSLSKKDYWAAAFESAGSAALFAGITGSYKAIFDKRVERTSIIPYIQEGDTASVMKSIDFMLSDKKITPEQADIYKARVQQLDDIYNKNKKVYDGHPEKLRMVQIQGNLIQRIDAEAQTKTDLENVQREHSDFMAIPKDPQVADAVHQTDVEASQKKVDFVKKNLDTIQKDIKDLIPDKNGDIPLLKKEIILKEIKAHITSTHVQPSVEDLPYAAGYVDSIITGHWDQVVPIVDNTHETRNSVVGDETKADIDNMLTPIKDLWKDNFQEYIKKRKEEGDEKSQEHKIRLKNRLLYTDEKLTEMLENEQLPEDEIELVKQEQLRRKNEDEATKKDANKYNPLDPENMENVLAAFSGDIASKIKGYGSQDLENTLLHDEIHADTRKAIEDELALRKQVSDHVDKIITNTLDNSPEEQQFQKDHGEDIENEIQRRKDLLSGRGPSNKPPVIPPIETPEDKESRELYERKQAREQKKRDNEEKSDLKSLTPEAKAALSSMKKAGIELVDKVTPKDIVDHLPAKIKSKAKEVAAELNKFLVKKKARDKISEEEKNKPWVKPTPVGGVTPELPPNKLTPEEQEAVDKFAEMLTSNEGIELTKEEKEFYVAFKDEIEEAAKKINPFFKVKDFEGKPIVPGPEQEPGNGSGTREKPPTDPEDIDGPKGINSKKGFHALVYRAINFITGNTDKATKVNSSRPGQNKFNNYIEGILDRNTHNPKIESSLYYNKGHKVYFKALDFKEAVEHGFPGDEAAFNKIKDNPALAQVGIFDAEGTNEFIGLYPDIRNEKSTEKDVQEGLTNRKALFENPESKGIENRRFGKLGNKSPGFLNFNLKNRSIFDALGTGKKLATNISLAIIKLGQPMKGADRPDSRVTVGKNNEDGKVVAMVPRADGSLQQVPITIPKLGRENAEVILKLLQAYFNKTGALRKEFDKEIVDYRMDSKESIMAALKQILYIQKDDKDIENGPLDTHTLAFKKDGYGNIIMIFDKEGNIKMSPNDLFPTKKTKTTPSNRDSVENFLKIIEERYRAVRIDNFDSNMPYSSIEPKDGRVVSKTYDNYQQYLNDTGALVTDLQGFPVGDGKDNYTFTSQSAVSLDPIWHTKRVKAESITPEEEAKEAVPEIPLIQTDKEIEEEMMEEFGMTPEEYKQFEKDQKGDSAIIFSRGNTIGKDNSSKETESPLNVSAKELTFVNTDDFSHTQQTEFINGMSSIIHTIALEGTEVEGELVKITEKDALMKAVKERIEAQAKVAAKMAKFKPAFSPLAELYQKALKPENYSRFERFTLEHLSRMGIEFKESDVPKKTVEGDNLSEDNMSSGEKKNQLEFGTTPTTIQETDAPLEQNGSDLSTSSQTHSRTSNEENYQFSESALNKTSSKLRALLSFVKKGVFRERLDSDAKPIIGEDGIAEQDIVNKKNGWGMDEYIPIGQVWNILLQNVHELTPNQIMPFLEKKARIDPMFRQLLDTIKNSPDPQVMNEFQVLLSKQQARFITVLLGKEDSNGQRLLKVMETNKGKADDIVMKDWTEALKTHGSLVKYDNKNSSKYVDTVEGEKIYQQYKKDILAARPDSRKAADQGKLISAMTTAMGSMGIDINPNFVNHLKTHGIKQGNSNIKLETFLEKSFELVVRRIAGRETSDTSDTTTTAAEGKFFEKNNPFYAEQKVMKILASVEAAANTQLYESSFVGGDGKARYSYVNNSHLSSIFKELTSMDDWENNPIIQQIRATDFGKNSLWLNNFNLFKDTFQLHYFDSLGNQKGTADNKLMKNMSEKEKELTRSALYQNGGKEQVSKYLIPVPGDKTMWPLITAIRIAVGIKEHMVTTKDADGNKILKDTGRRIIDPKSTVMSHLYNVFLSEHGRIKSVQKDIEGKVEHQLKGYHFGKDGLGDRGGMGEKFLTYDFLNGDENVFNKDGSIKAEPDSDYVKQKISEFFEKSIKDQEESWRKLGLIDAKNEKNSLIFDKSYHKNPKNTSRGFDTAAFAAEYTVNNFLFQVNYSQVIGGDAALFGKDTIKDTHTHYNKRMVKDMAPGLDPIFNASGANPNFRVMFMKDIKGSSQYLKEYAEMLQDKIGILAVTKAYGAINETDAQEYTTLDEHITVLKAMGQYTPKMEQAMYRLKKGGKNPQDISAIMSPMKPVYVGDKYDADLNIYRKYYFKTSSFPLIPGLLEAGSGLDKLRVFMEDKKNNVDRAVYESGVKLGLESNSTPMHDGESMNMAPDFAGAVIHNLSRKGFRIQQEMPYHGDGIITEGTQFKRIINGNLIPSTLDADGKEVPNVVHTLGQDRTVKEVHRIFEGLHSHVMELNWADVASEFGIVEHHTPASEELDTLGQPVTAAKTNYSIDKVEQFQKLLYREAIARGYATNELVGLNLVENIADGTSRFQMPLAYNSASGKFESIMSSIFNNRVIKGELPGNTFVQASGAGFHVATELSDSQKNDIVYVNPAERGKPLNYFSRKLGINGKNQVAEIFVPSFFKIDGKMVDMRKMDMSTIDEDLLHLFGYRIPTQGLNSMMTFKIKGFLPSYMGDLCVVPREITAQMGSDFDVDKMFLHHHNYQYDEATKRFDKDKLLDEDELKNITSVTDKRRLQNTILQHAMDRFHYADEKTGSEIMEPNGYGELKQLNDDITAAQNKPVSNFYLAKTQNEFHARNIDGLAGKGIFSLYSIFVQLAQATGLKLAEPIKFNVMNPLTGQMEIMSRNSFEALNVHQKMSASVVSFLQSAAVDNANLQYLSGLNINGHTMAVAGLIAGIGYDEHHIAYFLSQPSIRRYVEAAANVQDITDNRYDPRKLEKSVNKIAQEYLDATSTFFIGSFYKKSAQNGYIPHKVYSLDDMKQELTSPTPQGQLDMLANFLRAKEMSSAVNDVISSTNVINKGVGSSFLELENKVEQIKQLPIEKRLRLSRVENTAALSDTSTMVGKAAQLTKRIHDAFSDFFPYANKGYSKLKEYLRTQSNNQGKIKEDYLKELYKSINSYMMSNTGFIDGENMADLKERLLNGTPASGDTKAVGSLAQRILDERKINPGNTLLHLLKITTDTNKDNPRRITAENIPSMIKGEDNQKAVNWMYTLYDNERTRPLATDIVKYFMATGGNFNPVSLSRFIPLDILEDFNFSQKVRGAMDQSGNNADFFGDFASQYYRHKPEEAFKVTRDILRDKNNTVKLKGNTLTVEKWNTTLNYIKEGKGKDQISKFPSYLSMYDRETGNYKLFGLMNVDDTTKTHTYERMSLLGKPNYTEYDFNSHSPRSGFSDNNIAGAVYNRTLESPGVTAEDRVRIVKDADPNSPYDLRKAFALEGYNSDKGASAHDVLDGILSHPDTSYPNKIIAGELKKLIRDNLTVHESTELNAQGWYTQGDTFINMEKLASENPQNLTSLTVETLLHEMLHSVTDDAINSKGSLTGSKLDAYNRIEKLLEIHKNRLFKNSKNGDANEQQFNAFKKILVKIENKETLTVPEENLYNRRYDEFYPLLNVGEFVSGLSNASFARSLMNTSGGQGFWNKVFEKTMTFLGIPKDYRNHFEALLHSVVLLNDKESDYPYGWEANNGKKDEHTQDDLTNKDHQQIENEPEKKEEANFNPFGNVQAGADDHLQVNPNTGDNIDYSKGKSSDTAADAKSKIDKLFNASSQGVLPTDVNASLVRAEIDAYNEKVGFKSLMLKVNGDESLSVVKNMTIKKSVGSTAPKKSTAEEQLETMVGKIKSKFINENSRLTAKVKAATGPSLIHIKGRIRYNNDRIKELNETEKKTDVVDMALKHVNYAYHQATHNSLSLSDLDELRIMVSNYSDIETNNRFVAPFEAYNKLVKDVVDIKSLAEKLIQKQADKAASAEIMQRLDMTDEAQIDKTIHGTQREVNSFEQRGLRGDKSSNDMVRLIANVITQSKADTSSKLKHAAEHTYGIVEEYLKTNKDYKSILQLDKDGKFNGKMLNPFKAEYFKELGKAFKNGKLYEFLRDNTNTYISKENQAKYDADIAEIKKLNPKWDKPDTSANARFKAFVDYHDPQAYVDSIAKGEKPVQKDTYITQEPIDSWKDKRYDELMKKDPNSIERRMFDHASKVFQDNNDKYQSRGSNYNIPDYQKTYMGFLMDRNYSGLLKTISEDFKDTFSTRVEPLVAASRIDPTTGRAYSEIPVMHLSNKYSPSDKTYDLKRVLLQIQAQDIAIQHKLSVEPLLQYLAREMSKNESYLDNSSGGITHTIDEDGNVKQVILTSNGTPKALSQIDFMLNSYLYDKSTKVAGVWAPKDAAVKQALANKAAKDAEGTSGGKDMDLEWQGEPGRRYFTLSKLTDALSAFTRSTGLILKGPAALNNVIFGISCNLRYAVGRSDFDHNHVWSALADSLWMMIPSPMATKIKLINESFDVANTMNELKFNKIRGRNVEDPLSHLNWHVLSEKGEYFIQNHLAIAMMKGHKVGDTNLWDGYKVENGKLVWDDTKGTNPFDPTLGDSDKEKQKFVKELKTAIFANHGNYEDPIMFKEEWYGRMLMTYRTWIPEAINYAWGKEYTDFDGSQSNKGYLKSVTALALDAKGEYSAKSVLTNVMALYSKDPTLSTLSEQDKIGVKRALVQVGFSAMLFALGAACKAGILNNQDKDEKAHLIFLMNMLNRELQDTSFTMNPMAMGSIISNPVPAFNTIKNIYAIMPAIADELSGHGKYKGGIHNGQDKLERSVKKAVPVVGAIQNWDNEFTNQTGI